MATVIEPGEELFLDTSFAIALAAGNDQHHRQARRPVEQMELAGTQLVTTRAVLLEIGNVMSGSRVRAGGIALLHSLETDLRTQILPLEESLYHAGRALFSARKDKEWSLTDGISFCVMQDHGIHRALSADHHFQQAGFAALLLE